MNTLKRQGDAYEIVYVLIQVQCLILLERSADRQDKIFQTSVTNHRDASFDLTFHRNLEFFVVNVDINVQVGILYLRILVFCKEGAVSMPFQVASAGLQAFDGYYKGLQR